MPKNIFLLLLWKGGLSIPYYYIWGVSLGGRRLSAGIQYNRQTGHPPAPFTRGITTFPQSPFEGGWGGDVSPYIFQVHAEKSVTSATMPDIQQVTVTFHPIFVTKLQPGTIQGISQIQTTADGMHDNSRDRGVTNIRPICHTDFTEGQDINPIRDRCDIFCKEIKKHRKRQIPPPDKIKIPLWCILNTSRRNFILSRHLKKTPWCFNPNDLTFCPERLEVTNLWLLLTKKHYFLILKA